MTKWQVMRWKMKSDFIFRNLPICAISQKILRGFDPSTSHTLTGRITTWPPGSELSGNVLWPHFLRILRVNRVAPGRTRTHPDASFQACLGVQNIKNIHGIVVGPLGKRHKTFLQMKSASRSEKSSLCIFSDRF